jgi:hypothetical protein
MECICPNDMASTVQKCKQKLLRLQECLVSSPGQCEPNDLRRLLDKVLCLCISRFTDLRLTFGDEFIVRDLDLVYKDWEQREAGHQYWGDFKGLSGAFESLQQQGTYIKGTQRIESAEEYAVLLHPPKDIQSAELPAYLTFLQAINETMAALTGALQINGKTGLKLVASLSNKLVQACKPWLGQDACKNLGTCFKALPHAFEQMYASANLLSACLFVGPILLNNCAQFPYAIKRLDAWCKKHFATRRTVRLREHAELQLHDIEREVVDACYELFAPPTEAAQAAQASTGVGKRARDPGMSPDAIDTEGASGADGGCLPRSKSQRVSVHEEGNVTGPASA